MKKTLSLILALVITACLFASVMVLADEEPVTLAAPIEGEPVPDGEPIVGAPVPEGEEELVVLEPNGIQEGNDIIPKNIDGVAPMPEKTLAVTDIFVAVFCLILLIITGIYFYTMYKREQAKEAAEAETEETTEQN